jgi:cytochrome c peroxidase
MEQTKSPIDKYMFKVPSLRNVDKTGPYFHDGSVAKLDDAVKIMGKVQLNVELSNEEVSNMVAFLKSLTGDVPERFTKAPKALSMK